MTYEQERRTIIDTCLYMQSIGYFLSTWGNVSMRVGDRILLTPSRVCYDTMKPEDIVVIDLEGNKLEGDRNPTSEKEVHRRIYVKRPDVGAIIHAHTEHAMACSALDIPEVPCIVEEMSQMLGGSIPLTKDYVEAIEHVKLGMAVAEVIGTKNGALIRNHGPVACGHNMDEAVIVAKVVEKSCGIYLSISHRDDIRIIPQNFIDSQRHHFLYTYGRDKT